jgi:electron transfer flavoprotein beta subunit
MKIVVPVKLVPDLVEEITVDPSGTGLDTSWLRLIISEFDDHAIEQAILLKERDGAQVVIVTPESEGADDILFTAAAKGADQLIKLSGEFGPAVSNHALARAIGGAVRELQADLVLTGVQAHSDLDGSVGPLLAEELGMPYVGYVAGVTVADGRALVRKEYPGGLVAEMEVRLPAVLGIQAAEKPPRYVAVSKVRQAMQSSKIENREGEGLDPAGAVPIARMYPPQPAERATIFEGDVENIASKLVDVLREAGIV